MDEETKSEVALVPARGDSRPDRGKTVEPGERKRLLREKSSSEWEDPRVWAVVHQPVDDSSGGPLPEKRRPD